MITAQDSMTHKLRTGQHLIRRLKSIIQPRLMRTVLIIQLLWLILMGGLEK